MEGHGKEWEGRKSRDKDDRRVRRREVKKKRRGEKVENKWRDGKQWDEEERRTWLDINKEWRLRRGNREEEKGKKELMERRDVMGWEGLKRRGKKYWVKGMKIENKMEISKNRNK